MATEVLNFLPSEVARLVLGYLSDEGYVNSYKCFMKECPHLQEYLTLKRRGQNYPLHINGLTLNQMLQEYAQYKLTDTQRRQTMGSAALWSQLDAVVKTLKEHTASRQSRSADGSTQSTRVRRMMLEKKRRRETERRQRKVDLCSRTSATPAHEMFTDTSEKLEVGLTDTDMSEGEPPEAGNCGVLTPPTDSDTKKKSDRIRKSQEKISGRTQDTDNRETEFILHSAPPSVSSCRRNSLQRSSSVSDLLNNSAKKLHKLRGTADNRIESRAANESDMLKEPQRMLGRSAQDHSGAIQPNTGKGELEDRDVENSEQACKIVNGQDRDIGENYDNFPSEQSQVRENIPDDISTKSKVALTTVMSDSVISFQTKKEGTRDNLNMPSTCITSRDGQQTRIQTMSNGLNMLSPKPVCLADDQENNIEVLGGVLTGLPIVESLKSSVEQSSASKHKGTESESDHGVVQQTSSEENSQESSESGEPKTLKRIITPLQQALNLTERMTNPFQKALNLTEAGKIHDSLRTPVKQTDETSQTNTGRTPRRKRLPKQKNRGKGNSSLNDSNKSRDENSLLVEKITLFFNELVNNSLLHERLAANINKTLGLETGEKRTRKKSEILLNVPASPKPDKPNKPEVPPIPGESEPDKIQTVELQEGLNTYTFLDDILNMNETQMSEVQIGGIIERTSKDPNFESLFNLFQEPHSASENPKTDFSGIKLEMGKEATITNQSLPSFTEPIDCPDPSNTTSEENLIMEILQSPQAGPSQNCSYQQSVFDQTTNSQKAEPNTNVSGMEWSSAHPNNNQTTSTPTCTSTVSTASWGQSQIVSRNIFESVQQLVDHPPIHTTTKTKLPCDQHCEQSKVEKIDVRCASPNTQLPQLENSVPLALGQGSVSSQQQPVCSSVVIISHGSSPANFLQNCSTVAIAGTSSGPVLSLINSVMSPSARKESNQDGPPAMSDNVVPFQSPRMDESVKGQEVISSSQQPFTKLTNKVHVNVSCDVQQRKNSPVHSPVQRAASTNQMLSPLQSIVPTTLHQSPKLSQNNVQSPFHGSENGRSLALPYQNSGQSSTLSADSPQPNIRLQVSDTHTEFQQPNVTEQQFQKPSEVTSCAECVPSVKQTDLEQCNSHKNTRERFSQSKPGKVDRKDKSSSKKAKAEESLSVKSSKDQSGTDLVETFETSVSEAHGFPVISVKSVMKSPQEVPLEMDRNPPTADPGHPSVSYHSFIKGVAGEECSTPMTERVGARDSPHTSHSNTTNSGVFSEMMDFVSTLEKSLCRDSSNKKRSPKNRSGKRNSGKKKKEGIKETDATFASPIKKCQWSPDLKALIKLVTPEKKGKPKGKKSKKVVSSADKRRNPKRKVRKSNEENIRKDDAEPEVATNLSGQQDPSPSENRSEVITKPGSEVITKSVSEVIGKVDPSMNRSEVIAKPGPEVITKPGSEVIDKPAEGVNNLSMPLIHNFMSPVQITSGEGYTPAIGNEKCDTSSEVGLTPKTVLTAVSALKDNNKPSSRKTLPIHQNMEPDTGLSMKENSTALSFKATTNAFLTLERLNTDGLQQMVATDQDEGKIIDDVETDYSKIPYSPNRDFLASPVRCQNPKVAVSHGNQYYEHTAVSSSHQFDSPSVAVPHSSQIVTPSLHGLTNTTSQNTPLISNTSYIATRENVYSSGVTYIQNAVPYQGQVLDMTNQALNYNTVYIDNNGTSSVIQTSLDSVGQNVIPTYPAVQDIVPTQTPVTDILSAAASVITSSPLETVDGDQLSSTPERKDKHESVGQLIAIPVGRYYPEKKKLHVRSLDFGPDAGTVEIRKPGYGRGHKKKPYTDIKSPIRPGGLVNKQSKGKAKSKEDVKEKAKIEKRDGGINKHSNVQLKVLDKKEMVVEHTELKNLEKDDLIPDASGSIYIVEGNTRKKIKLNKTPRPTRTVSPYFLPNAFDLASGIIPVRTEIYKKGRNITVPAGVAMPKLEQISSRSVEQEGDSDVDVDGECDLPDLSPEPPATGTPLSKCSEFVQRTENTTPIKLSSGSVDKNTMKPFSVITVSDSSDSNVSMKTTSDSKRVTLNTGSYDVDSNPSSVRSCHGRPGSIYSNNSNSLPDLESPRPLINMSTPPKKRITASLKHGGGCYFFSTASQEGKSQMSTVESRECDTTREVMRVPKSPRTPKGKRPPMKAVRQSPRLFGSPNRLLRSMTSPTKVNPQRVISPKSVEKKKGMKRLRETTPGEPSKMERKCKKARNGKRAVDLSKVDFDKFLNKIHKT